MDIREFNRRAWDAQVNQGNPWTVPVSSAQIEAARRGESSSVSVEDLPLADHAPGPEESLQRKERLERLKHALGEMGERCRELFRLKLDGNWWPEIQRLLGVKSINTIYTWDSRCRKQLLDKMGGRWEAGE